MLNDQPLDYAGFGERLLADIADGLIASVGGGQRLTSGT